MRVLIFLLFSLFLYGCVWDFMPPYAEIYDEDVWIHNKTKAPLPNEIFLECRRKAIKNFEVIYENGSETIVNEKDKINYRILYGNCLREKGFIFDASFRYCYRFKRECERYKNYRK